jgi:Fe-S cluster assembly protein SufD
LPNDVICKHGSATGEIDKKQLYYLQTRGFRLDQAQNLLLKSFAQSALGFLEEESALQKIVESTLFTVMPA